MLLNNVNSFFVITQIRYMKSAQPCSGFANQQMFFRAAKSARPWSSPEPFEKKAYFVCHCLTSFAKPAGRRHDPHSAAQLVDRRTRPGAASKETLTAKS